MEDTEKRLEQWTTSSNGEDWNTIYYSREEAIEAAEDDLGLEPGDGFVLARAVPMGAPDLADMLAGAVESWVCDEAPQDCGEDYHEAFLRGPAADDLKQVLADWAKRHDVKPNWFMCEGEEHFTVPEPDSMKIDPDNIPA